MKISNIVKTAVFAVMFAGASNAFADDVIKVVTDAHDVAKPDFTQSFVQMDLYEKGGKLQESRKIKEYGRNKDDLTSMVMCFMEPSSVKDTRFLQIQNKDADDDKWIYLPSVGTTRRIAASEGSKSFMGTEASYDDLSTRDVDEDNHEFISENQEKNGYTCWVVKSTPKDPKSSQYSYRINYIDKKTNYPIYSEMYDKKGKLIKRLTLEKLENKTGLKNKAYDIPMVEYLENVQNGRATRLTITKIQIDGNIPDSVFTSSFLNTGKVGK